ncbi:pheromone A receptor-domain-containing protein [Russula aff. rugulosa BPL654]|nr:pheromone A receptor-domain-containing protein [Russula aff. rugulosa BPL654]
MAYPNGLFSAFSFIGFLLCLIPLCWHLEAWNVGTTLFMAWAGLGCLNTFINSVIWDHSTANVAPVWCDISSRFIVGLNVGIPAALLVINRRLYKIASRTEAVAMKAEKLRAVYVDLAIGLSIPLLQMILQITVEGHRFDIYEEIGCIPNYYDVTLAYPISFLWPLVLVTITTVYGVLNIRIFWRSSRMFSGILGSANKNPNQNRYNRLIGLTASQILLSLPAIIFALYVDSQVLTVHPWISWENTHFDYSFVGQIPSFEWRADPVLQTVAELDRWLPVVCAFSFFAFFGFAEEARRNYSKAYSFATSSLHIPNFRKSGVTNSNNSSRSPPFTPSSSFGNSFKFSAFKSGFSAFSSNRGYESEITITTTTAERKDSFLVSQYRLTSSDSIFEGIVNPPKAFELSPSDDDSQLAHTPAPPPVAVSRSAIEALAAVTRFPAPPPPIARVSVRSLPPGLYPEFPHSPTASDLHVDPSENV